VKYRYVGDGRWLPGIPARDLDGDDVARLPVRLRRRLTASDLYAAPQPARRTESATKEVKPDV